MPQLCCDLQVSEKHRSGHGSQEQGSQHSGRGGAKKPLMHLAAVQQQQHAAASHQESGSQAADDFLEMLLGGPKSSTR